MRFTCLQENLVKGIQATGYLAQKATNLPILNNIHLIVRTDGLVLSSTNLEAGVEYVIRGKIEEEGECLIPAKLLLDLIPLLVGGAITMETAAGGLVIKTETTNTTIRTMPTAEFPILPKIEQNTPVFNIAKAKLLALLEGVVLAAGKVEQRPQFNGVFISKKDKNQIVCAATDGFRLAETAVEAPEFILDHNVIIPLTSVQEIGRIFAADSEGEAVDIQTSETQARFSAPNISLITRLIDGEYPDYASLFPAKTKTTVTMEKSVFLRAVKAAALFSRSGMSDVTLSVKPTQNTIEVSSENTDVGAHRTSVSTKGSGEEIRAVLNSRYLMDGAQAISSPNLKLILTDSDRPILILPESEGEVKFRYLIMPIRQ